MRKPVFLIASDSFKDALSSPEVCRAIERGILDAIPEAETRIFPLGDGGEGTAESLAWHLGGEMVEVEACDPLFRPIAARYGLLGDGRTAVIEAAAASGLQLLEESLRNPMVTTTYGTGMLIMDAVGRGVTHLIICIGGSATHDCGIGMAEALGYVFLDEGGQPVRPVGGNLGRIVQIDGRGCRIDFSKIRVEVWCDVDNPLTGPEGAARVYAAQKGADAAAVEILEAGSRQFDCVLQEYFGRSLGQIPGAGAAGGLGAGMMAFLEGELTSGSAAVLEWTKFSTAVAEADVVFTGEGRLDRQTGRGKLIASICRLAGIVEKPVFALCGELEMRQRELRVLGVTAAISIQSGPCTLSQALKESGNRLVEAASAMTRVWQIGRKSC